MTRTLSIPREMRTAKRWFPVAVTPNGDKWDKRPLVEWSKPENWSTYADLKLDQRVKAVGFALGDGFFGIDLDNCLDESLSVIPERRELVNDVLEWCGSFTEVSWSGKGLHVYGYGKMPQACKDATPGLEMYSEKRFFLFTGRPFDVEDQKPFTSIQPGIEKLYAKYGRKEHPKEVSSKASVGEGHRSNTIFSKVSTLYKLGYSREVVIAAMQAWNLENCDPPLSPEGVVSQCEDRYPSERFPLPETEESRAEILSYEKVIETAAVNLVEFCENKRYVATGFSAIDQVIGRLPAGSMTVIGGETSAGKSHMVHVIARNAERVGNKPGIISLEDGIDEWGSRGIAMLTGVTYQAVLAARLQTQDDRVSLYEQIYRAPDMAKDIDIKVGVAISANLETVMQCAKSMIVDYGRNVLLVDYAQAVRVESERIRLDKAYADIAKRLKGLCAKHKIPLILNSQLSRSKTEPTINSLKESGDLENESEIVILLWRDKNRRNNRTLWRIAKAKWCGERPEGYIKFGIGGAIEDLVTEDLSERNYSNEYLD